MSAVSVDAAPSAVTTLVATPNCQIQLQWNAPDNGAGAPCGSYLVKYSTIAAISDYAAFDNGTTYYHSWIPLTPGATETKILTGLAPRTTYWFSIRSSSVTMWSALSSTDTSVCAAGSFGDLGAGLTGVCYSALSWGDYDNDGDLDLALSGFDMSIFSRVYRNNAGNFVNATGAGITGVYYSSLSWGDYDNDGDLDLALAGTFDGNSRLSRVYRNDAGSFVNATGTSITGVFRCSLSWGDYDNDGDLDLALAGATGSTTYISRVYRNDGVTFVNAPGTSINADRYCSLSWGDYDNDGDLDLALAGNICGSRVYRNDAGSFVNATGNDITGVYFCSLGWGDYDNDGDLDLALAGMSSFLTFYSRVYRNDAGSFVNATGTDITGVQNSSLSWGDYDNDGDLDLALAGEYYNSDWQCYSRVYRNDAGSFFSVTGDSITGVYECSLSWGDYDNDGDLDLALSGQTAASEKITRLYQSFEADYGNANIDARAPSAPSTGIDQWYSDANKALSLRWNKATDNGDGATPTDGLYYEIRMATETINDGLKKWIVSPSKGLGVGSGSSQNIGNYPHGYCVSSSTQPGAVITTTSTLVYWQVRTIDAGLRKSAWSLEQTYYALATETIPPGGISDLTVLYGGPDTAILQWTGPGDDDTSGDLGVGSKFRIKYSSVAIITAADFDTPPAAYAVRTIDISTTATALSTHSRTITGLTAGIYWFAIKTMDESLNRSVWYSSSDVANVNTLAWHSDTVPPGQVTGFTAIEDSQVQLTWTAPGDDGYAGNITNGKWRIDYSSTTTTPGPDDSYTLVISSSFTQGAAYTRTITGLQPRARYYFQMIAYDGSGNWGGVWSSSASAVAGTFVDIGAGLTGVYNSSLSWGDYDNDGDLDLALAGDSPTRRSLIYRNDAGSFGNANGFIAVGDGCSLSWGDYDNDGDLDLALAGRTGGPAYSRVYRNDVGSFVDATGDSITGVCSCSLSWGDYDNDGDLDLALAGSYLSRVYRNDVGSFVEATGDSITGVAGCSLSWGDYDNDGDLDLALAGSYGYYPFHSRVYRNDAGSFINATGDSITGVAGCSLSWGDYDNDGDLDLALAGAYGYNTQYIPSGISRVYRNDAGSFINATGDSITGVAACSLSWGDYDNDGNLDLALAGEYGASYYTSYGVSRIYRNYASNFFNATGDRITGVKGCSLSWGDYNNDGDLDFALSGQAEGSSVYITRIYQSFEAHYGNSNKDARAPGEPSTGFDVWYGYSSKTLSLRWSHATDNGIGATPVDGLYYEIRVATETLNDGLRKWVVSPSTGLGTGSCSSQNIGNYPHGYCVTSSVQPGAVIISTNTMVGTTYYWQVRTIDAGLRRSAWSVTQSYCVPPQEFIPPAGISDLTALCVGFNSAILQWVAPGDDDTGGGLVVGSKFRIKCSSVAIIAAADFDSPPAEYAVSTIDISTTAAAQSQHSLTITGLTEGMYWFAIKTMDESENWSVWNSSEDVSTVNTLAWCRDTVPPGQITGVTATVAAQVQLAWTAPGDDEYGGEVSGGEWRIDYSSTTTTPGPDDSHTLEIPSSFTHGESVYGCTITGLQPRAIYFFQIIARDGFGNWGTVWSDAASVMTGNLSDLDAGLTGVYYSDLSWGDYDNDSDLDLALSGYGDDGNVSCVYRNDAGSFVNVTGTSLSAVYEGGLSWGDYDNDGDLDLAVCGWGDEGASSRIYRNSAGNFEDINAGLPGVDYSRLSWGDYDNDGDLDLALAGDSGSYISCVYRNNAGRFVNATDTDITGVYQCSLSWGDYDNDGDLDLALNGEGDADNVSCVYRNDGGSFVNVTGTSLSAVYEGGLSWGDYDNDGDLDLAVCGWGDEGASSRIYRNSAGNFEDINAGLPGVDYSRLSWGDYDNDGDLDLVLCGYGDSEKISCVFRNDAGDFINATGTSLIGIERGCLSWGDFDKDGDLDLALSGDSDAGHISRIYTSLEADYGNSNTGDRAPSAPSAGLSMAYNLGNELLNLRWDKVSDNGAGATPSNGMYYEVRMATEPITDQLQKWVISPSTGVGVGSGASQTIGNYPHGYCDGTSTQPGLNVQPLMKDATYYCQVRAIDAGLCKSAWSVQQSTYVLSTDLSEPGQVTGLSGVADCQVLLSWTAPGDNGYAGNVRGGMWRIDYSSATTTPGDTGGAGVYSRYIPADYVPGKIYSQVITGLAPRTVYYFQVKAQDDAGKWSAMWSSSASVAPGSFVSAGGTGLPGEYSGTLSWGDYDNDGDLDLAVAAEDISRIYSNDGGSFVPASGASIDVVWRGSLSWGDYDNDGGLDLALSGYSYSQWQPICRIYRNDGGGIVDGGVTGIDGVYLSSLSWGDYDNDGDLDLALAGFTGSVYISRIYRNDAGTFTNATGTSIAGVNSCSLSWGDYDNDGDLDLALAGYSGSSYLSRVYRNDAGSFVAGTGDSITGVQYCSLSWGDYDNDGDLDLALAGHDGGSYLSRVYRSDAGSFANAAGTSITGVAGCSLSWGDYDNDGDLDLALAGEYYNSGWQCYSRVYRNDAGSFDTATGTSIPGVGKCSLSWGDYDNDGDLDLALSGETAASERITRLYQSFEADYGNANIDARAPSAPWTGLRAALNRATRQLSLRWNKSSDNGSGATPQNGLHYEIRVSTQAWETAPDNVTKWIVSPSTGYGVGSCSSQNIGNYPHGYCDNATLQPGMNLTSLIYDTTYYWQVRTIDAGLAKSPWSTVQSKYVSPVETTAPAGISDLTALSGSDVVTLSWTAPGDDDTVGDLAEGSTFRIKYSTVGILTADNFDSPPADYAVTTVDISTMTVALSAQSTLVTGLIPATTYWFAIKTADEWENWSVWNSSADVASVNTLAWRAVISLPPAPVTDLTAATGTAEGAVALTWTSPRENDDDTGGSVTRYIVKHATFSASSLSGGATAWWAHPGLTTGLVVSSASINAPGATETGIISALAPGVTYYFAIVGEDAFGGVSDVDTRAYATQATAAARDLPPAPPTGLAAVSVSSFTVSLAWDVMSACTGYMDFSYYALYRSTAGAPMVLLSTTTLSVYVDTAVIVATTYYYQLNAVDGQPSVLTGSTCPVVAVCTLEAPAFNSAAPRAPSGIKLESTRSVRTIRWSPVRYNSDGTPSTNLQGYAVYRSNDPRDGWTLAGTADTCAWNDTASFTGTWYYKVRAVTTDGVESADSLLCDTAFNILAVSIDGRALLTIPHTIAAPLYQGQVCDEDVNVLCAPLGEQSGLAAVAAYELSAVNSQTDEKVRAFRFPQTRAKLTYFCPDAGAPAAADNLAFSWFNGVEWIRVGTEQEGASIVTLTSRLGKYAIRETLRATTFTLYSVYPRTFSPNGDNRNDHVEFQYENPLDASVVGKIYDKAGALVTELREGIQMDSLMWDGTTSKGNRARPGAYVYQIEVTGSESKVINGIVVVAR